MSTVQDWRHNQNTIFKKTSEGIFTLSKWLITLVIDLKPNNILLDELGDYVRKSGRVRTQIAPKYESNEEYLRLLYSFDQDTSIMRN